MIPRPFDLPSIELDIVMPRGICDSGARMWTSHRDGFIERAQPPIDDVADGLIQGQR